MIGAFVALLVVITLVAHATSSGHNTARPPASASATPDRVSGPGTNSATAPTTVPGPTASGQPSTMTKLPTSDRQAVTAVVRTFIEKAYSFSYTDRPGDVDHRVKAYLAPTFAGTLPEPPSPTSNAGLDFQRSRTVSRAYVAHDTDIKFNWTEAGSAGVTVTVTRSTSSNTSDSSQINQFNCRLTFVRGNGTWLVSDLQEGTY
jgi:hypothetical protein